MRATEQPCTDLAGRSLVDAIQARAAHRGLTALIFPTADGSAQRVTTSQLRALMEAYAKWLLDEGLQPGDTIVIAVEHGVELVGLFLGALRAGVVPCVVAPAARLEDAAYVRRLSNATERVRARAVITEGHRSGSGLRVQRTRTAAVPVQATSGSSVAFIQLSSGSTGRQRAIAVTHDKLSSLVQSRNQAFEIRPDDVVVGWLPLYHDLGLVGSLITPLLGGIPGVLIAPRDWLTSPALLMHAVSTYGGSVCNMPNFGFNYCARRIRNEEMDGVDLSRWRVLCNSAEPVRSDSFAAFHERFRHWGFQPSAFASAYGLAENTLTATMTALGRAPRVDRVNTGALKQRHVAEPNGGEGSIEFVSCGRSLSNATLEIRSGSGEILGERHVGEIVLRSGSMADGYYLDAEGSRDTFRDGWLHTGDLGYLADGELYVCGRAKDRIIAFGESIYPEEIERVAAAVPGIRPGRVVAFGTEDQELGTETVVVLAELRDGGGPGPAPRADVADVERQVRRAIKAELGIGVGHAGFVPTGWIVKTTSGKVARSENRAKWVRELAARAPARRQTGVH